MANFICLQAGHEGRTSGATGAPGEKENNVRIRNRLSEILISKGFVVQLVNADPSKAEISKDFDLFLALHCDADIYGTGGGCVGSADPSVDARWIESARIRDCLVEEYFPHSEIVKHQERVNKNITFYYMWSQLSSKTPCVLIEMGVAQDAHDKVLLADTDRIANAIARGICKAFGVAFDVPQMPDCGHQQVIDQYIKEISDLKSENDKLKQDLSLKNAEIDSLKLKITTAKSAISNALSNC